MTRGSLWRRLAVTASAASVWFVSSSRVCGDEQQTPDTMYVQEDWVLDLNVPNDSVNCPQFHTIMSPTPDLSARYFQVNWNYQEQPDFTAGGLELLTWSGDSLLQEETVKTEQLSTKAETISWTQELYTDGNVVAFLITNGLSVTWGEFSTLSWGVTPGLQNLNGYSPDTSAGNSWITYGDNRVNSLKIVQVRYYDVDGNLIKTDSTPRVVFQAAQ